ncbi:MAG: ATP-dependent zinc protease [Balneolaceae bacterium]|nr:ATP-dependent zinc protease [Balneolaceae bacterium]
MDDKKNSLQVIGRTELVDIPSWDLYELNAKIDTGAYTSSLHCHHIEPFEKSDSQMVRFNLLDPSHEIYNDKLFELPVYKTKNVKSSNGQTEERIIVRTDIILAGQKLRAELSLTDRSEMRYPLLIGRKLLKGRFLVDVRHKSL